jgi:cardiolipin synthase
VGSIILAPGSFDGRRVLAIETDHEATVQRLAQTAERDWASSHKIDLSDAGLLHDLEKRQLDPSHLVLDGSGDAVEQPATTARKHHKVKGKH